MRVKFLAAALWGQLQQNRLHFIFLRIRYDPVDTILLMLIHEIILLFKDDLVLLAVFKKRRQVGTQRL